MAMLLNAALVALYILFGYRFDHTPITSNQPEIVSALTEWGIPTVPSDAPEIRWEWDTKGIGLAAQADPYDLRCGADCQYNRIVDHCLIRVNEAYWKGIDAALQAAIMTHEVGHCLGLAHDTVNPGSIMHAPFPDGSAPSEFDLEKIHVLYGDSGPTEPPVGPPDNPSGGDPVEQPATKIICPMLAS